MSTGTTKDWAEAHWSPLTGENTELTQFNIWHHRRFGFVDHRDADCGNRWMVWTASREALVIELPGQEKFTNWGRYSDWRLRKIAELEAAGVRVKP
ncbi:hypothetical protein HX787_07990 [Pseudomonas tolaasii]|uniref:Uncharacterized protein n=1 Tax=Pseudomonas tolaasii TaxID=29442 RepID=A0A7Y8DR56_PSETO|nr:hypothetical protein [Pseudomonas tolaasii]NWC20369.1 hypothetical protein [Pseudomonas tolaasii]NWD35794.1 hypothetical protein [Pseudomonas tolaasii]